MAVGIVYITLSGQERRIVIYLYLGVNSLLNNLLLIGDIPVTFIQLDPDQGPEAISEVLDK